MQTCTDQFSTVFSQFGEMRDYHRHLEVTSQWRRCPVRDLIVEPLDKSSALA